MLTFGTNLSASSNTVVPLHLRFTLVLGSSASVEVVTSLTFTGWQSVALPWLFVREAARASGFLAPDPGKAVSLEKLGLPLETSHLLVTLLNPGPEFR